MAMSKVRQCSTIEAALEREYWRRLQSHGPAAPPTIPAAFPEGLNG